MLREFVRDPKCRYSVHLPEASWHTAYDVCASSNRTLATITSLNEMYIIELVLEEVDALFEIKSSFRKFTGVWIGAFMRSSNYESMLQNCKHLDSDIPVKITGVSPSDISCLYYNLTEKTLVAEKCSKAKMFICERNDEDPGECMLETPTSTIHQHFPFNLCYKEISNKILNSRHCESECMNKEFCYTFLYKMENGGCELYHYKNDSSCSFGRYPPQTLKHKKVTKEVIQKKIAKTRKNLKVNRNETSQYIRTLTSAPDERLSSKNIGVVGAFVISAVCSLFFISDCINFIRGP
ncbi:uncharacterized protein LOC133200308 [Saccostrea echinata]|uniref:uncharacterized protein LOC133200308 n=1 Tax=Saccostrea echinata TaxID=191078 RepID=UPI002A7EDAFA|nr:uncharacterized protein LOC133200308 [Saccostrea echinata]